MNTEPLEQEEEPKPPRRKPVVVKLRRAKSDGPRLVGCKAYPTTGIMAGATVEWCREARGKMPACATCQWNQA
ncbi:MAG: hypothetical protein ACYC9M_02865 [Desulfobulbaceae bacterium]